MAQFKPNAKRVTNLLDDQTLVGNVSADPNEHVMVHLDDDASDVSVTVVDDTPEDDRFGKDGNPRPVGADPAFDPDTVEDLKGLSEKASKRIGRLSHEVHNSRRAAEAAARERDETLKYAQSVKAENDKLMAAQAQTNDALFGSMTQRHESLIKNAKDAFTKAHEEGDAKAMADAQEELALRQAEMVQIRTHQPTAQPAQPAPQLAAQPRAAQPQHTANQVRWLQQNDSWYHKPGYEDATGYVTALDQNLKADIKAGRLNIALDSEQYYNILNSEVAKKFSTGAPQSGDPSVIHTNTKSGGAPVAAANGSGNRRVGKRDVQITATAAALAKKLGLTPQQYAKQVAKLQGEQV